MIRKIIHIDEEKCDGCGLCATACHEGAIDIIDGKAKLVREHFCDGLGDCLPNCPTGAITFEEREASAYDEAAVKESQRKKKEEAAMQGQHSFHAQEGGCPGQRARKLHQETSGEGSHAMPAEQQNAPKPFLGGGCPGSRLRQLNQKMQKAGEEAEETAAQQAAFPAQLRSRLNQWPVQIKLLPVQAPFFDGAKLLIAADCTAYAYANMHEEFMKGRITLIGCPKLDDVDYTEKLTAIIAQNDIKSVTIVRMEVPCCGGLQRAAENALKASGKFIPWQVVTISIDGKILDV